MSDYASYDLSPDFRNNLVTARHARGISQADLAKATGIDKASISKYEKGLNRPRMPKLEKLHEGLKVRGLNEDRNKFLTLNSQDPDFQHLLPSGDGKLEGWDQNSPEFRKAYRVVAYLRHYVEQRLRELSALREVGVSPDTWELQSDVQFIYMHAKTIVDNHPLFAKYRVLDDWEQGTTWGYACKIADHLANDLAVEADRKLRSRERFEQAAAHS